MANTKLMGKIHSLTGTDIATSYGDDTKSSAFNVTEHCSGIWFYGKYAAHASSSVTSFTVKVQHQYNDGSVTSGWADLPTIDNDASSTREVEHAHTITAGATKQFEFFVDRPQIQEFRLDIKADQAGHASDTFSIYASYGSYAPDRG